MFSRLRRLKLPNWLPYRPFFLFASTMSPSDLPQRIRTAAVELPSVYDSSFAATNDFGQAFDVFVRDSASPRVILIGDASHGTSEFYASRAAITKRLIDIHGYDTVAVEADWPDAAAIDRHVRHKPRPSKLEEATGPAFQRFPGWMWKNEDVKEFVEWLKEHNAHVEPSRRVAFFGLDLYSLDTSIKAVIDYLERADPELAKTARQRYGCLAPYAAEPARYGAVALGKGFAPCEQGVVEMLKDLLARRLDDVRDDAQADGEDALFDAQLNAQLVADAEKYYRAMYYGSEESWNLRDTHMFATLLRLLSRPNPPTPGHAGTHKAVVWAHNSHVGDARHTGMGQRRGELNIGQLCKERFGAGGACIIGHGTHTGTVAAAHEWDQPMQIMPVNPSRSDSYERLAHDTNLPRFLLDLRRKDGDGDDKERSSVLDALAEPNRLERFIGVIYRPETELWSHYERASLPRQMDGYVWFDESRAVTALGAVKPDVPPEKQETYPFGL